MKSNISDYRWVYQETRGISPCITGFTDEPVVRCDVQVVDSTVDDSK